MTNEFDPEALAMAPCFGGLAFAGHPPLQQFGTITATMIADAVLGSVLVLPSLMVLWAWFVGVDAVADSAEFPRARCLGR